MLVCGVCMLASMVLLLHVCVYVVIGSVGYTHAYVHNYTT